VLDWANYHNGLLFTIGRSKYSSVSYMRSKNDWVAADGQERDPSTTNRPTQWETRTYPRVGCAACPDKTAGMVRNTSERKVVK
jgi:hypothetical protein